MMAVLVVVKFLEAFIVSLSSPLYLFLFLKKHIYLFIYFLSHCVSLLFIKRQSQSRDERGLCGSGS